jgi:hypothetical protein
MAKNENPYSVESVDASEKHLVPALASSKQLDHNVLSLLLMLIDNVAFAFAMLLIVPPFTTFPDETYSCIPAILISSIAFSVSCCDNYFLKKSVVTAMVGYSCKITFLIGVVFANYARVFAI